MQLFICDDCAIAAVNNDYTGMDDETATRVADGIRTIGEAYGHIVLCSDPETGDYERHEFSRRPCECCGTHLHGGRFVASVTI